MNDPKQLYHQNGSCQHGDPFLRPAGGVHLSGNLPLGVRSIISPKHTQGGQSCTELCGRDQVSDKGLPLPLFPREKVDRFNLDQSLREITIDLTKVEMVVTLGEYSTIHRKNKLIRSIV